jgi:hypothetical protein
MNTSHTQMHTRQTQVCSVLMLLQYIHDMTWQHLDWMSICDEPTHSYHSLHHRSYLLFLSSIHLPFLLITLSHLKGQINVTSLPLSLKTKHFQQLSSYFSSLKPFEYLIPKMPIYPRTPSVIMGAWGQAEVRI